MPNRIQIQIRIGEVCVTGPVYGIRQILSERPTAESVAAVRRDFACDRVCFAVLFRVVLDRLNGTVYPVAPVIRDCVNAGRIEIRARPLPLAHGGDYAVCRVVRNGRGDNRRSVCVQGDLDELRDIRGGIDGVKRVAVFADEQNRVLVRGAVHGVRVIKIDNDGGEVRVARVVVHQRVKIVIDALDLGDQLRYVRKRGEDFR